VVNATKVEKILTFYNDDDVEIVDFVTVYVHCIL